MKDCTYYDLLGVPMDASEKEIADAKNFLVKKMHPDANINCSFDTTSYIQNVLTAYRILSDPAIQSAGKLLPKKLRKGTDLCHQILLLIGRQAIN